MTHFGMAVRAALILVSLSIPSAGQTTDETTVIHVSHLTKYYGDYPAVRDVSFEVEKGKVVGFLGPNGAGKSTTMRVLAGYLAGWPRVCEQCMGR